MSLGSSGTVISEPSGGNVMVQLGMMKTRVRVDDVRLEAPKPQPKEPKPRRTQTAIVRHKEGFAQRSAATELDIRGCTVDEGVMKLEDFLSAAMLSGFETVTVIHGKGTGALRSGIQDHLRRMKQVRSFRPGKYGEGEDGVTIVTLK